MNKRYLDFLIGIVRGQDHTLLLEHLHQQKFVSTVPNDDNREEDGKKLRTIFRNEEGRNSALPLCLDEPCSVLEMLIGLGYRMENELEGSDPEYDVCDCFWMMMQNLDLVWADDLVYPLGKNQEKVDKIIRRFIDRRYDARGRGGLFPLKSDTKDQRRVEIWYQMAAYLLENFDF